MSPDDLTTVECFDIVDQIGAYAPKPKNPGERVPPTILVLSGGEPLWRADVFDIARRAKSHGLRVALATNGTLITERIAERIQEAGIERIAISLDGADAETHDRFRGQPGSFEAAIRGLKYLQARGLSTQINTTVSHHNAEQLPKILELAKGLNVHAFHLFLLVPVGCGLTIAEDQAVGAAEAEKILTWFYEQSIASSMEMKATCAPQYYRIVRQQRVVARQHGQEVPMHAGMGANQHGMNAMTRGCLAGTGVCFVSHLGVVQPCGYLPVAAGDLRQQPFAEVWEKAPIFEELRDVSKLEGKCGVCEFRMVCLGCRARAYGFTGDYLAEEPYCAYVPRNYVPAENLAGGR
jgi:radical SAM protein with 4Fe4S-binding SPASM domain